MTNQLSVEALKPHDPASRVGMAGLAANFRRVAANQRQTTASNAPMRAKNRAAASPYAVRRGETSGRVENPVLVEALVRCAEAPRRTTSARHDMKS
jgi:hypothetical protein